MMDANDSGTSTQAMPSANHSPIGAWQADSGEARSQGAFQQVQKATQNARDTVDGNAVGFVQLGSDSLPSTASAPPFVAPSGLPTPAPLETTNDVSVLLDFFLLVMKHSQVIVFLENYL